MKPTYAVLVILLALIAILPIWTVVTGAFSDWHAPFFERITLRALTLKNVLAWQRVEVQNAHLQIGTWLINSLVYSVVAAVGGSVITTMAGYGLARFVFPGRNTLSSMLVAMMIVPPLATYIPTYMVLVRMGMANRLGLILPMLMSAPQTLYARQFARGLSHEVFEAARVDGASETQIFRYIALPMLKPIALMTAAGIFGGMWNNLMWANVLLRKIQEWTIAQGLQWLIGFWRLPDLADAYGLYAATMLLAAIPPALVYIMAQSSIAKGLEGMISE